MLTDIQVKAINMLFEYPEEIVAKRLRIKRETLQSWKSEQEFAGKMKECLRENRMLAVRILSRLYVEAAKELEALIRSEDDKNKPRAIIEVLKASGLFKELEVEESDYIGSLIERIADEQEGAQSGEED